MPGRRARSPGRGHGEFAPPTLGLSYVNLDRVLVAIVVGLGQDRGHGDAAGVRGHGKYRPAGGSTVRSTGAQRPKHIATFLALKLACAAAVHLKRATG